MDGEVDDAVGSIAAAHGVAAPFSFASGALERNSLHAVSTQSGTAPRQ
jgi:hypothetical protein